MSIGSGPFLLLICFWGSWGNDPGGWGRGVGAGGADLERKGGSRRDMFASWLPFFLISFLLLLLFSFFFFLLLLVEV